MRFHKSSNLNFCLLPNRKNWFGRSMLILTVLFAFFWQVLTPLFSDDFMYQRVFNSDFSHDYGAYYPQYITTLSDAFNAAVNHYLYTNGRLANLVLLPLQLFPEWVLKALCGMFMALMCGLIWTIGGIKRLSDSFLSLAIVILIWVGLPWNDSMQSYTFQFNYTVSTVLMLISLRGFVLSDRRPGFAYWAILVLFALWHESFTIVFGAFMGTMWLLKRKRFLFFATVILFIGIIYHLCSGIMMRVDVQISKGLQTNHWTIFFLMAWTSILALGLWLTTRRRMAQERRKFIDNFGICLIASWAVLIPLMIFVNFPHRAHWANDILSIIFIILIIDSFKPVPFNNFIKIGFTCLYILWGISLLSWQARVKTFTRIVEAEFAAQNNLINDSDNVYCNDIPWWLMRMVYYPYNSHSDFYIKTFSRGRSLNKFENYIVLQGNNIGRTASEWTKVPGNNDWREPSPGMYVRPHRTSFAPEQVRITSGKPTPAMTPLNYLLGCISGNKDFVVARNQPFSYAVTTVGSDTLDIIYFSQSPVLLRGREVVSIDYEE